MEHPNKRQRTEDVKVLEDLMVPDVVISDKCPTDMVLVCKDRAILVHKSMLCEYSELVEDIVKSTNSHVIYKSNVSKDDHIVLDVRASELDSNAIEWCVRFMYPSTGIQMKDAEDNIANVWAVTEFFKSYTIQKFIISHFDKITAQALEFEKSVHTEHQVIGWYQRAAMIVQFRRVRSIAQEDDAFVKFRKIIRKHFFSKVCNILTVWDVYPPLTKDGQQRVDTILMMNPDLRQIILYKS